MTTGKDDTNVEQTEAFEALTMRDQGIGRVELAQANVGVRHATEVIRVELAEVAFWLNGLFERNRADPPHPRERTRHARHHHQRVPPI